MACKSRCSRVPRLAHHAAPLTTPPSVVSCQWLSLGCGENTYTMETGKCCTSGSSPLEAAVKHLPAQPSGPEETSGLEIQDPGGRGRRLAELHSAEAHSPHGAGSLSREPALPSPEHRLLLPDEPNKLGIVL